jgi:hypothetical protein
VIDARAERIARVICGVLDDALRASGKSGLVVLDDGSPEAALLIHWCGEYLAGPFWSAEGQPEALVELRVRALHLAAEKSALMAWPANKTALLLGRDRPGEPLLPLGDLYATQIRELARGWSVPADVQLIVDSAGGLDCVDEALHAIYEGWSTAEKGAEHLPVKARGPFLEAVRAGRFWRQRPGLVPKLGTRTIGIDLFA